MANYIKIGNTYFNTELLAFKTKREFLDIYSNKLLAKDLDEAWKTLKVYIKVEEKPKKKSE